MVNLYYNPTAGGGRAQQVYEQVKDLLVAHGEAVFVPSAQRSLLLQRSGLYVVIGGDGTFNTLLNELVHPEEYQFVLLPAGTSNSLSTFLSPNEDPLSKLRRFLAAPRFYTLDLPQLRIEGKDYRFINEASAGFAAAIAREVEQRQTKRLFNRLKLNELAYIATAFRCWRTDEPVWISMCNNHRVSGDLYPCVNANPTDGLIDIYSLACPRVRLPFELTRLVRAKEDKASDYVTRRQVTKAEFDFEQALPIEIDGNPLPPTTHLELSLYEHPIKVF